jgi:Tfp pilus assembly protein PilN
MPAVPPIPRPFAPAAALAPPPERVEPLNLARRPFLNSRPVVRVALLLWLLGFALLAVNLSQVWSYRGRSADKRERIARGEAEIERQQAVLARLQKTLDGLDLEAQNQKVEFLNKQIAERTFSWSQLLDHIAERLPNDVRLNRLTPLTSEKAQRQIQQRQGGGAALRARKSNDEVPLLITGEARNDDAVLSFVDALFKSPFAEANLTREEREDDGKTLKFEISVQYRPGPAAAATAAPAGPAPRIEELPTASAPAAPGTPPPTAPKTGTAPAAPRTVAPAPPRLAPPGPRPPQGGQP